MNVGEVFDEDEEDHDSEEELPKNVRTISKKEVSITVDDAEKVNSNKNTKNTNDNGNNN